MLHIERCKTANHAVHMYEKKPVEPYGSVHNAAFRITSITVEIN